MASNMWRLITISAFLGFQLNCVFAEAKVVKLDEDNWEMMLTDEWMVEFYAPWCPACNALQPVWDSFSRTGKAMGINVGQVDVTSSPGLSGRFMVTALPTIYHVLNGEFRQYRGARDEGAFVSFIKEKKWKSVDAIPSWKSPETVQMSVVSYFFKLSQVLRSVHNNLMEEYGLPTWGSYLIFAVATILVGAVLGLMLVCIIDVIYPPKPLPVRLASGDASKELNRHSEELIRRIDELDDHDLVDENSEGGDAESDEYDSEYGREETAEVGILEAGVGDSDSSEKDNDKNVEEEKERRGGRREEPKGVEGKAVKENTSEEKERAEMVKLAEKGKPEDCEEREGESPSVRKRKPRKAD